MVGNKETQILISIVMQNPGRGYMRERGEREKTKGVIYNIQQQSHKLYCILVAHIVAKIMQNFDKHNQM